MKTRDFTTAESKRPALVIYNTTRGCTSDVSYPLKFVILHLGHRGWENIMIVVAG